MHNILLQMCNVNITVYDLDICHGHARFSIALYIDLLQVPPLAVSCGRPDICGGLFV